MTLKVHKDPWKIRPILCFAGTFMNDWSKWLDYQLQKCKPFVSTFLRDGQQVLDEISGLRLPPNARIATADANSMYNYINTDHACIVIKSWLWDMTVLLGDDFPVEAIIKAMNIIMRNNIFEWGSLRFLQLLGTAMGTSAAVMWATLYYGYHEEHHLIPTYGQHLLYFRRYIDDIILIWLSENAADWEAFKNDLGFGILTWAASELSSSVDFLDMTISIVDDRIETRTYQKAMNLYLYLPPSSAHTRGVIKGMIYGLMSRYKSQNTHRKDYIFFTTLLFRRLLARRWQRDEIYPIFVDAAERLEQPRPQPPSRDETSNADEMQGTLFFHLQYHPHDVSRREIRSLFEKHCGDLFRECLDVDRLVIAYSRLHNIGEYCTQAKLHEAPGKTSADIMGEYRDGLAPP